MLIASMSDKELYLRLFCPFPAWPDGGEFCNSRSAIRSRGEEVRIDDMGSVQERQNTDALLVPHHVHRQLVSGTWPGQKNLLLSWCQSQVVGGAIAVVEGAVVEVEGAVAGVEGTVVEVQGAVAEVVGAVAEVEGTVAEVGAQAGVVIILADHYWHHRHGQQREQAAEA